MRTIRQSSRFKRDYKKVEAGRYGKTLSTNLAAVLSLLTEGKTLPERLRDHGLTGEWAGFRDCHIHPDLVLIYSIADANVLELARLASHSELF